MVSSLVIGIAGTHSTGKSTFCNELRTVLESRGIRVETIPSFGALAVQQGIPLLNQHTYDSTMWFIDRTLEAEQVARANAEVVLVDRPVIDAVAYWNAAVEFRGDEVAAHEVEAIGALMIGHSPNYTTVLATKLDPSIALGPGRDTDSRYRAAVDAHLHELLNRHSIHHQVISPGVREALLAQVAADVFQRMGLA
ncbi:ATP-binding protein [Pseudomonas sp. TNT2022 ID357]|uniref:ATP-binding protein n=1 Tax=Pseudomonas idahonensis TaxID=2942628 RepID=A0ABT5Q7S6_9PSED|nr:AAA family ATPase [Pseudomonas idahonensis]MDD1150256.1 ATP-binding protein [Pseudomonas idahonensis]